MVFGSAAVCLARISPIMFGDKLLEASFCGKRRRTTRVRQEFALLVPRSLGIFHFDCRVLRKDSVSHRPANVIFAVEEPRS